MDAQTLDPKTLPREQAERRRVANELKGKAQEAFSRGELLTATLFASDLLMLYPNERGYLDLLAGRLGLPDALVDHIEATVSSAKQPVPAENSPSSRW